MGQGLTQWPKSDVDRLKLKTNVLKTIPKSKQLFTHIGKLTLNKSLQE